MLLALDISLTTGFALGGVSNGAPRTGLFRLPEGDHNFDRALQMLREGVMMQCRFNKVEIVAIEAAMQKVNWQHSAYAAFLLTSLSAVAREAAQRHGARIMLVNVKTWRSSFIGNGNMEGEKAKRAACARCDLLGWNYRDGNNQESDDIAEACGLFFYAMGTTYPRWRPSNPRVFVERRLEGIS
jgi:hypothetical protein